MDTQMDIHKIFQNKKMGIHKTRALREVLPEG
jgi:hypothetical protein